MRTAESADERTGNVTLKPMGYEPYIGLIVSLDALYFNWQLNVSIYR